MCRRKVSVLTGSTIFLRRKCFFVYLNSEEPFECQGLGPRKEEGSCIIKREKIGLRGRKMREVWLRGGEYTRGEGGQGRRREKCWLEGLGLEANTVPVRHSFEDDSSRILRTKISNNISVVCPAEVKPSGFPTASPSLGQTLTQTYDTHWRVDSGVLVHLGSGGLKKRRMTARWG